MTNLSQPPSRPPFTDQWVGRFGPLLLATALFVLVYGVELGDFGLSIDEEIATFITGKEMVWLQQGRWGMSLLTLILPNFEAIPLLSTILFGAGLVFAAWRAIGDFGLSRSQAYLFVAVHTGFPIWLHVAEFNTLAGGFGFGIAAAALGSGLAIRQDKSAVMSGLVLIAFAVSVYQTLALYSLLYIVLAFHALPTDVEASHRTRFESLLVVARALVIWAGGVAAYWVVQRVGQTAFNAQSTYVGGYLQLDRLVSDPAASLAIIEKFVRSLLLGRHPLYLSWGAAVLFLSWLGMLPWRLLDRDGAGVHDRLTDWAWVLLVAVIGMALVTLPVILSVASLPARAYVTWPLLAAWMASRMAPAVGRPRFPRLQWLAIGYFSVTVVSIGASLFYSDQVVHDADSALTERLLPEMHRARAKASGTGELEFTIAGTYSYPARGQIQRAELFGTSFYEHDGGNVYRVFFYMQLHGMTGFRPVPLGNRPDLLPAVRAMPDWPAPGSVEMANGVVVIKFGEPTPPQMPGA